VLEVFDARYKQFDGLVLPDIAQNIFSLDSPETRVYARKWLARPFPEKPNQSADKPGTDKPAPGVVVGSLLAENPIAARAGILPGDEIVAVNQIKVTDASDAVEKITSHKNELIALDILRQGKPITFSMKTNNEGRVGMALWPRKSVDDDPGKRLDELYRWSGELSIRFWSSLLLLRGDAKDQELAINGLQKFFDKIGLGATPTDTTLLKDGSFGYIFSKPAVEQILKVNRKDAHDVACCLGKLPYSSGYHEQLHVLRLLFNAGCPEALNTLTTALRLPPRDNDAYTEELVDGKKIKNRLAPSDYLAQELVGQNVVYSFGTTERNSNFYPDWGPPFFQFGLSEPEGTKQVKREKLAQYLEEKFQDIKEGRSSPLSNGD
jgi:hypothetical protein